MPRLLLIDDNLTESARFMQMLAEDGYLVEHVASLAEGLERTSKRAFDVLLLDLNLPDSQGIATYLVARDLLPSLPIVVLTDLADDHTVSAAYLRGAQDYLIKSIVTHQWLAQSVKHAMFRGQLLETQVSDEETEKSSSKPQSVWVQEQINEIVVLRLLPKRLLDASTIVMIEERLTLLVDRGNHHLVISMENVEYISNPALGVLVGAQKKIRVKNGTLHLADLRESVRNQLGARQFHRIFHIYDNVASAIAAIAATS